MLDNNDFALASADDTSVVVLEQLSSHPQPEVREAVARNPNTPTKVLLKLGKEFPDAITANPVFNLLLLENPESHFVRLSLARSTTTSEDMIAQLSKIEDEEILCAVAGNLKTPLHILEELVENPPLYPDPEYATECDFDRLFIAIAHNPNTSESLLLQLAERGSSYVEMAIAQNPKTPLSLLNKFADWENFSMHEAIARNPQAPSAILEKLAGEDEKEVRDLVKNNPNVSETAIAIINFIDGKPGTSIDLLEQLASDRRASVRLLVAAHPSTPAKVLEKLAQDTDEYVSFKAASNPNATSTVLEFFAEFLVKKIQGLSSSNEIMLKRRAVQLARSSDITPKVLETLSQMKNEHHVLVEIASSLKTPPTILLAIINDQASPHGSIELFIKLAENPNTPSDGLEKLYLKIKQSHYLEKISGLYAIAAHPNTPIHLLEQFAVHHPADLRAKVARNVNTPISILERLSNDSQDWVSAIAKQALKARA